MGLTGLYLEKLVFYQDLRTIFVLKTDLEEHLFKWVLIIYYSNFNYKQ